jgi:predicted amidohydrolase
MRERTEIIMLVATIQLAVNDEIGKAGRFEIVETLLSQINAGSAKPDLILLPELWGCGYFDFDSYTKEAEALKGATFQFLSAWASRLEAFILGGSIIEADGNDLFNTAIFINRQGKLEASYRKIHLFGYQSQEPLLIRRGESPVTVRTDLGVFGLSICYDLRFPEQYRKMVEDGAEIFLITSAWPDERIAHWRLFNQARALENQSWLVSCNCAGVHKGKRYGGHSMTVSPMGEIICGAAMEPTVLWSQIDPALATEYRRAYPSLADRVSL